MCWVNNFDTTQYSDFMYFFRVYVCNLQNIHSLLNVVILFAIKTCQPCHYIKPMTHVYTRERHENKNTRFWATYGSTVF